MGKKISAEIVADSINSNGNRITTFLLTYPRFIHGEIMTHRVFSRNSASSRAIPFEKMVKMVEEDPFIPIAWQKEHKGMQGSEYITEEEVIEFRKKLWLQASEEIIEHASLLSENLNNLDCNPEGLNDVEGVTKQLCNRLLEPFMWHTCLVTSTEFDNFFDLRCPQYWVSDVGPYCKSWKDLHKEYDKLGGVPDEYVGKEDNKLFKIQKSESQAEIHIQALAEAMWDAMNESTPKLLQRGEWHIPFGDKIDSLDSITDKSPIERLSKKINHTSMAYSEDIEDLVIKISTARCARLSFMTFDGEINYEKDIKLHDQLLESKHFSPFEHIAKCTDNVFDEYGKGTIDEGQTHIDSFGNLWSGNFKGWIQYRQLVQ